MLSDFMVSEIIFLVTQQNSLALTFRFLAGAGKVFSSFRYGVQTATGLHTASYRMGTVGSYRGIKAV
jgi:hypothetical protein